MGIEDQAEDQVCRLKLAKELEELGVNQDSLWCWKVIKDELKGERRVSLELMKKTREWSILHNRHIEVGCKYSFTFEIYSAFTDAELEREIFQIIGKTFSEMYEVQLISDWLGEVESLMERASTGANAKAKILIYLLKNNLTEK